MLVQADSGAIDAACRLSRSGPAMSIDDVLTARGEDRVVERLVAHRLAHPAAGQMLGHQGRQDADHHDVGAVGVGLGLGGVQAGAHLGLEFQRGAAGQRTRRHIEFDVVGAQFGLIGRVGDRGQHFGVDHGRLVVAVDEVALDLHAGQRAVELEAGLREHGLEHVEAQLHLAPVLLPVRATELGLLQLLTHRAIERHR